MLKPVAFAAALMPFGLVQAASPLPPADYSEPDFVGVDGCLYSKTQVGKWQVWVQRLDEQKRPVCGLTPTETGSDAGLPMIHKQTNT